MDSGQSCNCGHCWSCDPEGNRHREFESLQRRASEVAHDDVLFEQERDNVRKYTPSSEEYSSFLDNHYMDIFIMACNIRNDEKFFKEHGRDQTIFEFLNIK